VYEPIIQHEPLIRLFCSVGVLILLAAIEWLLPRRPRTIARRSRWPGNLGIAVLDSFLVRIILPTGAVTFAILAERWKWGLFHHLNWPASIEVMASVLVLDLAIYFQHRLFHGVPLLWRLHRMHHADLDVDVTTGNRFHPIEILLSMGIKFGVVAALGAPALSVLLFEILLNASSLFNHSNIRIPLRLEPALRWIVVTPDMHRVHHSILVRETNSNYGFNFPLWDRFFRTYRPQPEAGHANMILGLETFRDPNELRLTKIITQPFRSPTSASSSTPASDAVA